MANFMVDSADRNLQGVSTSIAPSSTSPDTQAWNDFTISKAQPVLDSFARRIACVEVQMPWAIPNITTYNNTFYASFVVGGLKLITVPVGFYTGDELALAVTASFASLVGIGGPPPTVAYDAGNRTFTITTVGGNDVTIWNGVGAIDYRAYYSQASLLRTLGFTPNQFGIAIVVSRTGIPTFIRYTNFVDITSTRLNYNSDAKDGTTKQNTIRDYVVRIYIGNDINTYIEDPAGTRPFEIHRQICHPKFIRMNPEQFLNSVDFQVRDEFGNLVYVPLGSTYPDFKLTFVASEQ
jgi:hypothetical protein